MENHNSFTEETHDVIRNTKKCWYCETNRADSIHHIVGRGNGDSTCESSICNACFLCNFKCHLPNHGKFGTDEWKRRMLNITLAYLIKINYIFKSIDIEFMEKYKESY